MNEPSATRNLHAMGLDIERTAAERGLVVMHGVPDTAQLPQLGYQGDWQGFLALAERAGAAVFYVQEEQHDPERLASLIVAEGAGHPIWVAVGELQPDDPDDWMRARLRDAIGRWDEYRGMVGRIRCAWCREGVAHLWELRTAWDDACRWAAEDAWEDASTVAGEHRRLRTEEAAVRLHRLATELAHDARFPEATSEAKRAFMAEQLFPDAIPELEEASGRPFQARSVAERAALIYWWEIEPAERATMAERARDLRSQGESIRNIAAVLRLSEAKVRAALEGSTAGR